MSFELSVFGHRILVNSGTSHYGEDAERHRQRGTAAHNTVMIDGENSSEIWAGFRVARRARPIGLRWGRQMDHLWVEGGHDGYRRLPGRPQHWRRWRLAAHHLTVHDRISGEFRHAVARYHLHPAVQAELNDVGDGGELRLPNGATMTFELSPGSAQLVPDTWHPRFGASVANLCLEIPFTGRETTLAIRW